MSGGIGESPSPTPSSDYDDNLASAATATIGTVHGNGGIVSSSVVIGSTELGSICSNSVKSGVNNAGGIMGMANASSNLNNLTGKIKRSHLPTHNNGSSVSSSKGLQISQKATVHYVSILSFTLFGCCFEFHLESNLLQIFGLKSILSFMTLISDPLKARFRYL